MSVALNRIQKSYPQVEKLVDSKETISIKVLKQDAKSGRKKEPESCALAKACLRQKLADAVMIGLSYSYLINGKTATRYATSKAVRREITSFDRTHYFAEGDYYKLSKVSNCNMLGKRENYSGHNPVKNPTGGPPQPRHYTSGVRLMKKH